MILPRTHLARPAAVRWGRPGALRGAARAILFAAAAIAPVSLGAQGVGVAAGTVTDHGGHDGNFFQASARLRQRRAIGIRFEVAYSDVRIRGYTVLPPSGYPYQVPDRHVETYNAGLAAHYRLSAERWSPYVVGGVGMYATRIDMLHSGVGANAGAGVEGRFSRMTVFAELRTHVSLPKAGTEETGLSRLTPVVVGLRF